MTARVKSNIRALVIACTIFGGFLCNIHQNPILIIKAATFDPKPETLPSGLGRGVAARALKCQSRSPTPRC